ncbi:MAG: hypothetical protein SF052_14165 [Bacteroidia bacterium]|nr:hypothetical protein [Bacteroidia bacterium]
MFYFTGIVLSVFLCFLLLLKKEKNAADKIFGGWLAIIALHLLFFYFDQAGVYLTHPHLLGMVFPLPLLHGVFLYFYVSAVVEEKQRSFPQKLLHFIPFFLIILLAIPFYSLSGEDKRTVFESQGAGYEFFRIVKTIMILGSGIFYPAFQSDRKSGIYHTCYRLRLRF